MYESPYQKEETEELITQVNELREALAMCWRLLPDGDYGVDAVTVKRCMTKFNCWPEGAECAGFDAERMNSQATRSFIAGRPVE